MPVSPLASLDTNQMTSRAASPFSISAMVDACCPDSFGEIDAAGGWPCRISTTYAPALIGLDSGEAGHGLKARKAATAATPSSRIPKGSRLSLFMS